MTGKDVDSVETAGHASVRAVEGKDRDAGSSDATEVAVIE
jgi:hypothetical protein